MLHVLHKYFRFTNTQASILQRLDSHTNKSKTNAYILGVLIIVHITKNKVGNHKEWGNIGILILHPPFIQKAFV